MTAFIQGHVPTHTKEINVPFFQVFTAGWQQENRTKKDTLSFCTTAHPFSVNRRVVEHCIKHKPVPQDKKLISLSLEFV